MSDKNSFLTVLGQHGGSTRPNVYNTAWLALVPSRHDVSRPAWPHLLTWIAERQLADGSWGSDYLCFAHERTISTVAALLALLEWGEDPASERVQRGVAALHALAPLLTNEPNEPVGFELLLPRMGVKLERHGLVLPAWPQIEQLAAAKMALVDKLVPDYDRPRSWWFNLELLLPHQLARLEPRILNIHGSVVSSPAATAAYLRALRLDGRDSDAAHRYLEWVQAHEGGAAGTIYPLDGFEVIWRLDNYRRVGMSPQTPWLQPFLDWLEQYWHDSYPQGVSYSPSFPVPDGDDTSVAYTLLKWAGREPGEAALYRYWDAGQKQYLTYLDERTRSSSVAVHALEAFLLERDDPEKAEIARHLTNQLRAERDANGLLFDKWNLSPIYTTSHLLCTVIGWDDALAKESLDAILALQRADGGWGCGRESNLEESCMALIALCNAHKAGLAVDKAVLKQARDYFVAHDNAEIEEVCLWIGKAVYQPVGIVQGLIEATRYAIGLDPTAAPKPASD